MKKLLFILLAAIVMPVCALAQDSNGSIVITRVDGGKTSIPRSNVEKITFDYIEVGGLEEIDLGLSVNWSPVNIDLSKESKVASSPEAYGSLIGWADTSGVKTSKEPNDYPSADRPKSLIGTPYDIAAYHLGDGWRMPTIAEFNELLTLEWERTTMNDVPGILFKGKNGNTLFLPYCGYRWGEEDKKFQVGKYGYYWSAELNPTVNTFASELNIGPDICRVANMNVVYGCSLRPVKDKVKDE
ncbi:MAG: hypothetical protein Q4B68_07855 [Bacteroidales bacterium]|nr:hypothetical protein [Bacteroidales bacterium]